MNSSFRCPTCGGTHDGAPTDHGWKLPDVVWNIPEEKRSSRARFNTDLCQLGDRFFIRCILKLPFNVRSGYYGWGVWVELSRDDFYRYVERYDQDGSHDPMVAGSIANKIPGYSESLGLPVMVQFQNSTSRPTVHVPKTTGHALADEQALGIDDQRYHAILESIRVTGSSS
ncbi:DUF2199 domain-containing protein [Solimonas marina]|uniref:DUF2199 domain-containing protein n=1 Tax=Solimonas marina TaxID=2714601 RepID=A0A970B659_9GAMM|nr:DUF2199 domain-containing protein [Solimonas marina]NKF24112.1 DUF2199 domain-containing protein [Solimonas marina]